MTDLVDLAAELRDKGMSLAQWGQDAKSPCWSMRAGEALVRVAKRQATLFTDDLRRELQDEPVKANAYGPVWNTAVRKRVIERTNDTCYSADARKRKHRYAVYRSLIYRGTP